MALDPGLTTHHLLSAMDGVIDNAVARSRRLDDAIERALSVPGDAAAFRTAAVGRCPYISVRTGPEGLLGNISPPEVPKDWTAVSVDGSHIDLDRHLPLHCFLINPGAAPSPTSGTWAASCSASPPWPWRTTCTCIRRTAHPARLS